MTIESPAEDVREALEAIWDDGNAAGLDGWVGPGRGASPIDAEAVEARRRAIERHGGAIVVRPRGTVTDAEVEAAARALFEDPMVTGDGYTWAEMVADDPSRADIWRAEARRILEAAAGVVSAGPPATAPTDRTVQEVAVILLTRDVTGTPSLDWDVWAEQCSDDDRRDALRTAHAVVQHMRAEARS